MLSNPCFTSVLSWDKYVSDSFAALFFLLFLLLFSVCVWTGVWKHSRHLRVIAMDGWQITWWASFWQPSSYVCPQRISDGNIQSKVTVVSAEPGRAREGERAWIGWGVVDRGLPALAVSIHQKAQGWHGSRARHEKSRGGGRRAKGSGQGRQSLACLPPALKYIPRHLPSFRSPSALDADVWPCSWATKSSVGLVAPALLGYRYFLFFSPQITFIHKLGEASGAHQSNRMHNNTFFFHRIRT